MIGHVVGFNKVDKANIRIKIMVPPCIEECFQGEKSILASKFRGATKLESGVMFV